MNIYSNSVVGNKHTNSLIYILVSCTGLPYPEGTVGGTIQTVNNKVQNECHYIYVLQLLDHLKTKIKNY